MAYGSPWLSRRSAQPNPTEEPPGEAVAGALGMIGFLQIVGGMLMAFVLFDRVEGDYTLPVLTTTVVSDAR